MKYLYYAILLLSLIIFSMSFSVKAASVSVATAAELITEINNANGTPEADTITLTADIVLTAADNATNGANGLPVISSQITIDGDGHTLSRDSSAGGFRIFYVSTGNLTLQNITVRNGLANIDNGGFPYGGDEGGAVYNEGSLTIIDSSFQNNVATPGGFLAEGGAILNVGTAVITGSTFSGNSSANRGGAIFNDGTLTLKNSTLSGNSSGSFGSAIMNFGTATITNVTIASNSAAFAGAGAYANGDTDTVNNTIIASNTNGNCRSGALPDAGANNLSDTSDCGSVFTTSASINLGTLANNGGTTQTHALLTGSSAIDTGNPAFCPSTDQRGFTRPNDGDSNGSVICDIGAFERIAVLSAYFNTISSLAPEASGSHSVEITVIIPQSLSSAVSLLVQDEGSGSASSGSDYSSFAPISIDFPAGTGAGTYTRTVSINILDDSLVESAETLDLSLSNASGGIVGSPSTHSITILDDDVTVLAQASILDINQIVQEGNTAVSITVQLDIPAGFTDTGNVTVEIVDASTGNATSGTDYSAFPATTLTFTGPLTAGSSPSQTVTVNLLDDTTIEGAEALALQINAVTGAAEIGFPDTHTVVINDNDANVYAEASFVANSALINENAGTLSIDVQLFIPIGFNLTGDVSLTISDALAGNASSGSDYTSFASVMFTFVDAPFVPGTTYTQTVTLDILDDSLVEGAETAELAISGIAGPANLVAPAAFTAIINDDEIATVIVTEPGEETVVTVNGAAESDFISKTVDNPFATIGQTVTYTIRAHNPKSIPLTQVVIYDVFDERLSDIRLLSSSHGAGVFDGNTLTVSGFTLQPNEEAIIQVSARIASLAAGDTIPNAAILESPNASVHVSNLALVGANPQANNGGASQVFVIPSQLPSTGETPLWRYGIFALAIASTALLWLLNRKWRAKRA